MSTAVIAFEDKTETLVERWLAHFRAAGFPYPDRLSLDEKHVLLGRLRAIDFGSLISDGVIAHNMEGNDLAWSYFPHRWIIRANDMRTPMEVFESDEHMRKVLRKCIKFDDHISPTVLRHWLTKFSGTQAVSNFRPTAAGAIYRHFLPKAETEDAPLFGRRQRPTGVVWDMSSGFGGRLLGAIACGAVKKYIGTDPSTPTFTGLQQIAAELGPRTQTEIELHQMGSEVFQPEPESLDLCFTSPPYFDCEKYTDESTQSYKQYNTQQAWLDGFMAGTLENCIRGLKPTGTVAINIAAVKSYPDVCADLVELASLMGLQLVDTLKLSLRKIPGSHNATSKNSYELFKYEPVFIFKKAVL
jgi:hypothetical protein